MDCHGNDDAWRRVTITVAIGVGRYKPPRDCQLVKLSFVVKTVMVMSFRYAALALLALASTISCQFVDEVSDTDDSVLISNGVADCIDAMIYINEDSIDTTTIGTGAIRTIAGVVTPSVPSTETETDFSNIYYTATVTRETTSAVTTLVIADICTFKLDCTSLQNYNFSCTYDILLATPSYEFSDSYYATATDNDDLATTWGISI